MQASSRFTLCLAIVLASTLVASASPHVRRGPTAPRPTRTHANHALSHSSSTHGIDADRATQLQSALIKAGYLTGSPTGTWDASSQAAMEKLQADNGWQTRLVPDSRAIIKLGLGPGSPTAESVVASGSTLATPGSPEPDATTPSQK